MLRGEAYEVVGEAHNGNIAVDLAERPKPDIICLDTLEKIATQRRQKAS